jgi:hypothetical protein
MGEDDIYWLPFFGPDLQYINTPVLDRVSWDIGYYRVLLPSHLEYAYKILMDSYDWLDDEEAVVSPFAYMQAAKRKKRITENMEKDK